METLGQRIKIARGSLSQDNFSKILGINKGSLGFYERDVNLPNIDVVLKICAETGVSLNWLVNGTSYNPAGFPTKEDKSYPVRNESGREIIEATQSEIVMIPMVEAVLSAGTGSLETSGESERKYSFRRDFLNRKGQIKDMVLMRVAGDSMEPEIKNKDVVLIDQSQTKPRPGSIYAIGVEDMVYLKRVDAKPGKLILYSDNASYDPIEIDTREDLEQQARIIGRVLWISREV